MDEPRFMLEFVHTIKTKNMDAYKKALKTFRDELAAAHEKELALFEVFYLGMRGDETEIHIVQRWECSHSAFAKLPGKYNTKFFAGVKSFELKHHTVMATHLLDELSIVKPEYYDPYAPKA